jgi:hypothetical protein
MPRRPTIHDSPPLAEIAFVCAQCSRKFRSKAGRTRHINAKHGGLRIDSPQSAEDDDTHDISSCPGFPSPTPLSQPEFGTPPLNSDIFNFGEDNFVFNNGDIPPSPSESQDTASISPEYHPYLNGKMNTI